MKNKYKVYKSKLINQSRMDLVIVRCQVVILMKELMIHFHLKVATVSNQFKKKKKKFKLLIYNINYLRKISKFKTLKTQ